MSRLPLVRLLSGVLVALLGPVVADLNYMNVGYLADLDETAARLGDDETVGSLVSFAAGVLLVGLGALGAATSSSAALSPREADSRASQLAKPSRCEVTRGHRMGQFNFSR